MAVVFAYTNRYRDLVDFADGVETDPSGLPMAPGPWSSRIQKVAFWHSIPIESETSGGADIDSLYSRGVIRGGCSITDLKASMQFYTTAGDYLIVDFDSAEPKYFIKKGVRSFRAVRKQDLPRNILDHMDDMDEYGARHLCYGEKINQDSSVTVFTCNLEDIDFLNFQPVQSTQHSDLWAIAYGAYYAECVNHSLTMGNRHALASERDQAPSHIMANPKSLGTPLYVYKQPGEWVSNEDGADLLIQSGDMYHWTDVHYEGLVLDQVVRVTNPELTLVSRHDPILYGDIIGLIDGTYMVAEDPSPDSFSRPVDTNSFLASSVIGQVVGNRTVFRRQYRDMPMDTRLIFAGYRFLNRDDHVQTGDFQIDADGMIKPASNVGKKLSENSTTTFRAVGKDGWGVVVRDQITEDMEVEWQVRDRGEVWIDWTPWVQSRDHDQLQEYERQYYTVYFRKKVPGFRTVRRGDPNFQLPYGLEWAAEGEVFREGCLEIVNGELRPIPRAMVGKVCVEPHIYVKPTMNPFHNALPFPSVLTTMTPVVECLGRFLGGNPFEGGSMVANAHQMVVSRHGVSLIPIAGLNPGYQETPIGNFYPYVFKINGLEQIIYCTDQVNDNERSALVTRGIISLLGAVQRHLPFFNVIPAQQVNAVARREVRAIEL